VEAFMAGISGIFDPTLSDGLGRRRNNVLASHTAWPSFVSSDLTCTSLALGFEGPSWSGIARDCTQGLVGADAM